MGKGFCSKLGFFKAQGPFSWLEISHVCIGACSHYKSITWLNDILGSYCNASTKVHNYKAFNIGLQIKATAGGGNYKYRYCTRKTVIIM